jgi:hypothetical protein
MSDFTASEECPNDLNCFLSVSLGSDIAWLVDLGEGLKISLG